MPLIQTSKKIYKEVINETGSSITVGAYVKLVGVSAGAIASVDLATSQDDNIVGYCFKPIPAGATSSVIVLGESIYPGSFTGIPLNSPLTFNTSGLPVLSTGSSKIVGYSGTASASNNLIYVDCRNGSGSGLGESTFIETTLSNQNDYAVGYHNHIVFREAINLTGIVYDGNDILRLSFIPTVVNPNAVILKNADVLSLVANRFSLAYDFNILQNESVTIFYDPTLQLWKLAQSSPKYLESVMTATTSLSITHNFGRYPIVEFINASGVKELLEVQHNSRNQVTVTASIAVTGTVILTGA